MDDPKQLFIILFGIFYATMHASLSGHYVFSWQYLQKENRIKTIIRLIVSFCLFIFIPIVCLYRIYFYIKQLSLTAPSTIIYAAISPLVVWVPYRLYHCIDAACPEFFYNKEFRNPEKSKELNKHINESAWGHWAGSIFYYVLSILSYYFIAWRQRRLIYNFVPMDILFITVFTLCVFAIKKRKVFNDDANRYTENKSLSKNSIRKSGEKEKNHSDLYAFCTTIATVGMFICTVWMLYYTGKAENRAEKTVEESKRFIESQIKPQIQNTPVEFILYPDKNAGETLFEMSNYSGYDAYDVSFDLKYENNDWIDEWIKASDKIYGKMPLLKSGGFVILGKRGKLPMSIEDISAKKGFNIEVITNWRNEKKELFQTHRKYKLVCTTVEGSRSFKFIPKE